VRFIYFSTDIYLRLQAKQQTYIQFTICEPAAFADINLFYDHLIHWKNIIRYRSSNNSNNRNIAPCRQFGFLNRRHRLYTIPFDSAVA
jgi:UDP-3-O-acyl-N-acetylglucosamine deacetylase